MNVFFLKGLNGLRALAALAVLASHIMRHYGGRGLDLAGFGVTVFFALSGFLITLLLIKEKEKTASVSIRKFYIRRILRIWPLYYLYIALALAAGYFIFAETYTTRQVLFYVFFLPNVPFIVGPGINLLLHYWSLGVEEQFYFFWPFVVKKFLPHFLWFSLVFITAFIAVKVFLNRYYGGYSIPYTFIYVCRFDCMAIGGLGAYLFYYHPAYTRALHHIVFQGMAWGVMLLVFLNRFHVFSIIDHEIVAGVTVVLIVNQVANPKSLIKLENKVFDYLGKISFGIYVYHPLLIAITAYLFAANGFATTGVNGGLFAAIIVATTLLTAHISYRYFELQFLHLKEKFAVIKSTNSATAARATPLEPGVNTPPVRITYKQQTPG